MSDVQERVLMVINRAREAGFIELINESEVINEVKSLRGGDVNIILYEAGGNPILINAAREEGYISLALLDLNIIKELPLSEAPGLREGLSGLEDLTTRIGYELYGDRALAPFIFPLGINENVGKALVAVGIKSVVPEELFDEDFLNWLIEDLELNHGVYVEGILNALKLSHDT